MRVDPYLVSLADPLRSIAANAAPREACGVITRDRLLVEVRNHSETPTETFDMGALHELEEKHPSLVALWHTHPEDQSPSTPDIFGCQASFLPWVIASPAKLFVIYPEAQPYGGVEFEYGTEDCWTRVTDWFAQEHRIFLPWFDRPADGWWATDGPSPYVVHAPDYGFRVIPFAECGLENLHVGDVILMRVRARRTNHAAVYLGGGRILHHLYGELSRIEQFEGAWQRCATHICRHSQLAAHTSRC